MIEHHGQDKRETKTKKERNKEKEKGSESLKTPTNVIKPAKHAHAANDPFKSTNKCN